MPLFRISSCDRRHKLPFGYLIIFWTSCDRSFSHETAVIQGQNFVVVGLAAIGGQNHEEFDEGAVLCSDKEGPQFPRLVWAR
jgi:hypothetical protein